MLRFSGFELYSRWVPLPIGYLHDDIIYYYDQNPSGFSFLAQITAFVI